MSTASVLSGCFLPTAVIGELQMNGRIALESGHSFELADDVIFLEGPAVMSWGRP